MTSYIGLLKQIPPAQENPDMASRVLVRLEKSVCNISVKIVTIVFLFNIESSSTSLFYLLTLSILIITPENIITLLTKVHQGHLMRV